MLACSRRMHSKTCSCSVRFVFFFPSDGYWWYWAWARGLHHLLLRVLDTHTALKLTNNPNASSITPLSRSGFHRGSLSTCHIPPLHTLLSRTRYSQLHLSLCLPYSSNLPSHPHPKYPHQHNNILTHPIQDLQTSFSPAWIIGPLPRHTTPPQFRIRVLWSKPPVLAYVPLFFWLRICVCACGRDSYMGLLSDICVFAFRSCGYGCVSDTVWVVNYREVRKGVYGIEIGVKMDVGVRVISSLWKVGLWKCGEEVRGEGRVWRGEL